MRPSPFALAQGAATAVVLARLARGRSRREPLKRGGSPPPTSDDQRRHPRARRGRADRPMPRRPARGPRRRRAARRRRLLVGRDGRRRPRGRRARARRRARSRTAGAASRGRSSRGCTRRRGDVVVFLDADARPRPGLVRELAALLDEVDFVTAGPRFHCAGYGERLLHPRWRRRSPTAPAPATRSAGSPLPAARSPTASASRCAATRCSPPAAGRASART